MIKSTDIVTHNSDSAAVTRVGTPKSRKTAQAVHLIEKAEEIAKRVKDASALEKALLQKLEYQRDFAAEYQAKFPYGTNQYSKKNGVDTAVHSSHDLGREEWCMAHGFHERTVRRWCDLLDESTFVEKKNAVLKRCWELAELWQAASFSSESVEWYTPARYFEGVRETLGEIDLDPASNPMANATVGAKHFFTKEDDGLELDWYGRVFVNPPYGKTDDGKSLAGEFCNKAVREYENGNIDACIILVNSLHSQAWQAPLYKHTVCFVDHRIQFVSGDGDQNKNPTFQNIFVYLGKNDEAFASAFQRFGYVMRSIIQ